MTKVLRITQVEEVTTLGRSTIYAAMKAELFPKSIKLGKRAVGWKEDDINSWIDQRDKKDPNETYGDGQ